MQNRAKECGHGRIGYHCQSGRMSVASQSRHMLTAGLFLLPAKNLSRSGAEAWATSVMPATADGQPAARPQFRASAALQRIRLCAGRPRATGRVALAWKPSTEVWPSGGPTAACMVKRCATCFRGADQVVFSVRQPPVSAHPKPYFVTRPSVLCACVAATCSIGRPLWRPVYHDHDLQPHSLDPNPPAHLQAWPAP